MPAPHKCSPVLVGYGGYLINQLKTLLWKIKTKPNISRKEQPTLIHLKRAKDIIIRKADKGGGIVVIDSREYLNKINVMLSDINRPTYTQLPHIHLKLAELDIMQDKRWVDNT